jgi:hypothetical protein
VTPQDALALQIGRAILDLHIARQTIATQAERIAELEARIAADEPEDPGKPTA